VADCKSFPFQIYARHKFGCPKIDSKPSLLQAGTS
jgi:hypothetical protein